MVEVTPRGELDNLVDTCLAVELPFDCKSSGNSLTDVNQTKVVDWVFRAVDEKLVYFLVLQIKI